MTLPLLALLLAPAPVRPALQAEVPVTIEEYLALKDVRAVQVAPAGNAVAFTVTAAHLETSEYRTELYVWRSGEEARALTRDRKDVARPRWSPDGAWLAFLSKGEADAAATGDEGNGEKAKTQIWLLPVRAGGEAVQLSKLPGGVFDYSWAPDGSIYALTQATTAPLLEAIAEGERKRKDDPILVREEAEFPREFWRIAVPGGAAEYIWGDDRGVREFALSPGGEAIAFATNYSGSVGDYSAYDLWVLELESRSARQLTDRTGAERRPVWSPDGGAVVFQATQNPELSYSQTELFRVAATGGRLSNLTNAFDRTIIDHAWPQGGELVFTAALGGYTHLFALEANGAIDRLTAGSFNYDDFDSQASSGTIYAVRESPTEASELWGVNGFDSYRLTNFNSRTENWRLGRQELIQWMGPDGLAVEGLLVYPADYEQGRRYPLLVNPHGGPSSRVRDVLDQFHGFQLFAAHGYAVLAPNFRGSTGYGETFGTANRADLGGGDYADVMAGVDRVIAMGVADSSQLGIYGGSYGGYMTNWAITQTPRFAAAVSMYGIFNLVTDYSNSNIPRWEYEYLRAYYWEDLDVYLAHSPMMSVADIQTPVLIVHGADDPNTFISNSNEMYRALREMDRTVEFVKYPREGGGHGIREPQHRVDLFFRQLRWFDRYIKLGGADEFEFYHAGEWAPGPDGWTVRVLRVNPQAEYTGLVPASGRYLEVALALRPDSAASRNRSVGRLSLDLADDVTLVDQNGRARRPAGTVTELFGFETLVTGSAGALRVPPPERGKPGAVAVALAFEIPSGPGEYRLSLAGFRPVRIWVAGED